VGKIDIEGALRRLDKSTQAEDWMATAQLLKITNGVDDKVNGVAIRSNCCSMVRGASCFRDRQQQEAAVILQLLANDVGEVT